MVVQATRRTSELRRYRTRSRIKGSESFEAPPVADSLIGRQAGEEDGQVMLSFPLAGVEGGTRPALPVVADGVEELSEPSGRNVGEIAAFEMPRAQQGVDAAGVRVIAVKEHLAGVVGLPKLMTPVPLSVDDHGIVLEALSDDAQVHLRKADVCAEELADGGNERDRPAVGTLDGDVIFDLGVADLLVDLNGSLHLIKNVPAELAGVDEPVEHGLAFVVTELAGIEILAGLVQDDEAVSIIVILAFVATAQGFEVSDGRAIGQADNHALVPRAEEFVKVNVHIGGHSATLGEPFSDGGDTI